MTENMGWTHDKDCLCQRCCSKRKVKNKYEFDEEDDAELSFELGLGQMDGRAVD